MPAVKRCDDAQYTKFQVECLRGHIGGFNLSGMLVLIEEFCPRGTHLGFRLHESYNLPDNALSLLGNISNIDICAKHVASNTGQVVLSSSFMPLQKWFDTEIHYYFKIPLEIHHSASVVYRVPFKRQQQFRFVCFSNMSEAFDSAVTSDEIEYFMLPLFLGWLCRKNYIDQETLNDWLEMLVGMTPMRLALLREMVNIGRYQNKAIAKRLDISDRVVRNYIAEAYSLISHLLPAPEFSDANLSQCVDLVRCYHFLSLVGVSTNEFDFH